MKPNETLVLPLLFCCLTLFAQSHDRNWFVNQATSDIQAKQFNDARRILQEGTKRYSDNTDIWNLLGIADAELEKTDEAESAFLRGLKIAPDSVSLNENIGLLFYRLSDFAKTRKYLARAVALGSKQPGVLFSLAASQLRTGDPGQALKNLNTIEPALEKLPAYWEERGRAELFTNAAEAEGDFLHALTLQADSVSALNGAATAAEHQGLGEKALSYLIQARAVDPNHEDTLIHFGAVCIRRDLGPDAIDALERARQLDPQSLAVLFLLARAHISVQDWQQSYGLFQEYAKRAPNDASAFYAMGWVAIQMGRTEDAQRQLEHCLVLDPHLADARYELAQLYLNQGRVDTAEKLLQEVIKQEPKHAKAQIAMGDLVLRRGDLNGAEAYFETAVRLDSTLAPAHYKLSTVLFRKHEEVRAASERTLAAKLEAEAKQASKTQLKLVLPEAGAR